MSNDITLLKTFPLVFGLTFPLVSHFYRECPEECRDAVPSLMYAAARFADLPELRDLRSLFTEKYGNSLEYYINKEVIVQIY